MGDISVRQGLLGAQRPETKGHSSTEKIMQLDEPMVVVVLQVSEACLHRIHAAGVSLFFCVVG